jgi:hypothetical protein
VATMSSARVYVSNCELATVDIELVTIHPPNDKRQASKPVLWSVGYANETS